MAEHFNSYYTFLGLDEELTSPSYYQLLRLKDQESDPDKIHAAAAKAATRVRGHRPGEHAGQWSKLLDEIQAAKDCLLDANRRQAYDQNLSEASGSETVASETRPSNPAPFVPAMTFVAPPQETFAYPPGAGPVSSAPAPYTSPAYNYPPTFQPIQQQAYSPPGPQAYPNPAEPVDPMAPVLPAMAGPMSSAWARLARTFICTSTPEARLDAGTSSTSFRRSRRKCR